MLVQTLHNCASKASWNMGGRAPEETLSCLPRQPLLCPSVSHLRHKTDARAHEGHDARRLSSARAETITQQSGRSRCDTLTAARCGGARGVEGGEGTEPGLFLKPPSVSSARSAQTRHHSMHRLTWRAGGKKNPQSTTVNVEYLRSGAVMKEMDCQR